MNEVKDKLNVRIQWLVITMLLITFAACSNKKKVVVKNDQGQVEQEYYVDKKNPDKKIGQFTGYYSTGKVMEISHFKDGKLDGIRTLYYESGQIMVKENYKDGLYEGPYTSYLEDGSLETEGIFKDNARNGLWKLYYKDPKNVLKQEVTFKDNIINGPSKEYYPNGKLMAEGNKIEVSDGFDVYDGIVQIYDSTGQLSRTVTYEKGRQIDKSAN